MSRSTSSFSRRQVWARRIRCCPGSSCSSPDVRGRGCGAYKPRGRDHAATPGFTSSRASAGFRVFAVVADGLRPSAQRRRPVQQVSACRRVFDRASTFLPGLDDAQERLERRVTEEGREPSPIGPLPTARGDRGWASQVCESLTCSTRSRPRPSRVSTSSSAVASALRSRRPRHTGGTGRADAEAWVPRRRVAQDGQLGDRTADRATCARRVLHAQPQVVGRELEELLDRRRDDLDRLVEAVPEM